MSIKIKSSKFKVQSSKKDQRPTTHDPRLIFITGGCRSGKSAYALKLAKSIKGKKVYLATGEPKDDEISERIKKHKKERGDSWATIEEPIKIVDVIKKNGKSPLNPPFGKVGQGGISGKKYDIILLDCLTLWVSNLMHQKRGVRGKGQGVRKYISAFVRACKKSKANIIIVSNEVGMGIVPDNTLARQFRDIVGFANQSIAKIADEVYFVVSGIPMRLK